MVKSFKTHGRNFLSDIDGTPSSPSHSENHDIRTMRTQHFTASLEPSINELLVGSSSGVSYTVVELCMCTDYSRPLEGQLTLPFERSLTGYGETLYRSTDDPKCVQCDLVRPYRLTFLNIV